MSENEKHSNESQHPQRTQETYSQKDESHEWTVSKLLPPQLILKTVQRKREDARFWLALLLIGTLCAAILFYLAILCISPSLGQTVTEAFEKICFVLSPLVALMLGWYYKTS